MVQNTVALAPTGPQIAVGHRAGTDGTLDLLPFEQEMVDIVNAFIATRDPAEQVDLMKKYQKLYTENLYAIGLTQYPGALIINKRFANIPPGAPIFMFNWAEDNIIRERVFVPADKQPELSSCIPKPSRAPRATDRCRWPYIATSPRQGGAAPPCSTDAGADMPMLRFLVMRMLAAMPILFVLSVVTFAIIQAPPGRLRRLHLLAC